MPRCDVSAEAFGGIVRARRSRPSSALAARSLTLPSLHAASDDLRRAVCSGHVGAVVAVANSRISAALGYASQFTQCLAADSRSGRPFLIPDKRSKSRAACSARGRRVRSSRTRSSAELGCQVW